VGGKIKGRGENAVRIAMSLGEIMQRAVLLDKKKKHKGPSQEGVGKKGEKKTQFRLKLFSPPSVVEEEPGSFGGGGETNGQCSR